MTGVAQTYTGEHQDAAVKGRIEKLARRIAERAKTEITYLHLREEYNELKRVTARLGMFDVQNFSAYATPEKSTVRIKPMVVYTRGANAMQRLIPALSTAFVTCFRTDRVVVDADPHRITITIHHKSQ